MIRYFNSHTGAITVCPEYRSTLQLIAEFFASGY